MTSQPTDNNRAAFNGKPRRSGLTINAVRLLWHADRSTLLWLTVLQTLGAAAVAAQLWAAKLIAARLDSRHLAFEGLVTPLGLLFMSLLVAAVCLSCQAPLTRLAAERAVKYFLQRVLESAVSANYSDFHEPEFYDGLQIAKQHGSSSSIQVALNLPPVVGGILTATVIAGALLFIHPALLVGAVLTAIPSWLAARKVSEDIFSFHFGHTPAERQRLRIMELLTRFEPAGEIKVHKIGPFLIRRWLSLYEDRMRDIRALARAHMKRAFVLSLTSTLVVSLTMAFLVTLVLKHVVSLAAAVVAAFAMVQLSGRLQDATYRSGMLYESVLFLDQFQSLTAGSTARIDPQSLPAMSELRFEGVSFRYPGSAEFALRSIDLRLRTGSVVALVGENGAGKSTLARLVAGLYAPTAGAIRWNGKVVDQLDGAWPQIAVLFQDFVRLPTTLKDNILLGREMAGDELDSLLRDTSVDEFVSGLSDGVDTVIGVEFGGPELSGGQWQRVALARCLARDARLVVLDEPTASLDAFAEEKLFSDISRLCKGRAVLLISHRFSTVRSADYIYVLSAGEIAEAGTHDELIRLGGIYKDMYGRQVSALVGGE